MTTRLLELAGPAGSGKSTLAASLAEGRPGTRIGLEAGRIRLGAALAGASPSLALARLQARGRSWTRAELRSIIYLEAWQGAAGRAVHRQTPDLVLLDHGPVFRLAILAAFGPPMVETAAFRLWWERRCAEWAFLLDTVVLLDAPDGVLLQRIGQRLRTHRVEGVGELAARDFLRRYRRVYADTLTTMASLGTRVEHVDTTSAPPAELARSLHARLGHGSCGRPG